MKELLISDVHPEKGTNEDLKTYLLVMQNKGYGLNFIGDCGQYPDTYSDIKNVNWISGNHDSDRFKEYSYLADKSILLIHGHQVDDGIDTGSFGDTIWGWFKDKFTSKKLSLGKEIVSISEAKMELKHPKIEDEMKRLNKLYFYIKNRFPPFVKKVIMGHLHIRYVLKIKDIIFYNCGKGWPGEHILLEEDNKFYFNHFKNRS